MKTNFQSRNFRSPHFRSLQWQHPVNIMSRGLNTLPSYPTVLFRSQNPILHLWKPHPSSVSTRVKKARFEISLLKVSPPSTMAPANPTFHTFWHLSAVDCAVFPVVQNLLSRRTDHTNPPPTLRYHLFPLRMSHNAAFQNSPTLQSPP